MARRLYAPRTYERVALRSASVASLLVFLAGAPCRSSRVAVFMVAVFIVVQK